MFKMTVSKRLMPALLTLLLLSSVTWAAEDEDTPWYQISVVIFRHLNSPLGNEQWPNPDTLDLSFPQGILELEPAADDTGPLDAFRLVEPQDDEFQSVLCSLKLSSNYRIMTQVSWNQPALDSEQAIPVLIQAGDQFGDYHELEGSVTLVVARYLHLRTELWLSEYIQQVEVISPWWETANTIDDDLRQEDGGNDRRLSLEPMNLESADYSETVTRYKSVQTVPLRESRRMRSGELHYLDNPLFGVLVKVVPYTPDATPDASPEAGPDADEADASAVSRRALGHLSLR